MSPVDRDELREASARLAREDHAEDPAPDFAELLAARRGERDAEATARAERAWLADPELARALLDAEEILDELDEAEVVDGGEDPGRDAAWRRFEATLGGEAASKAPEAPGDPAEPAIPARRRSWSERLSERPFLAMAASAILASALTWLTLGPEAEKPREKPRERGRVEVEHVSPPSDAGPDRGGAGALPTTLEVSRSSWEVHLHVSLPALLELGAEPPEEARAWLWMGDDPPLVARADLQDEGDYLTFFSIEDLREGPARIEIRVPERDVILVDIPFVIERTE